MDTLRLFLTQNMIKKKTQRTEKVLKCEHREACKAAFSVSTKCTRQTINAVLVQCRAAHVGEMQDL